MQTSHQFIRKANEMRLQTYAQFLCWRLLYRKFRNAVWLIGWSHMSLMCFIADVLYLEFAKAFDSVCHARLLSKLRTFGIGSPSIDWFRSYLIDRYVLLLTEPIPHGREWVQVFHRDPFLDRFYFFFLLMICRTLLPHL